MSRLLTTHEAALAVGVDPATIRSWANRGWIKLYGTPQRRLYVLADLQRAQHRRQRHAYLMRRAAAKKLKDP